MIWLTQPNIRLVWNNWPFLITEKAAWWTTDAKHPRKKMVNGLLFVNNRKRFGQNSSYPLHYKIYDVAKLKWPASPLHCLPEKMMGRKICYLKIQFSLFVNKATTIDHYWAFRIFQFHNETKEGWAAKTYLCALIVYDCSKQRTTAVFKCEPTHISLQSIGLELSGVIYEESSESSREEAPSKVGLRTLWLCREQNVFWPQKHQLI